MLLPLLSGCLDYGLTTASPADSAPADSALAALDAADSGDSGALVANPDLATPDLTVEVDAARCGKYLPAAGHSSRYEVHDPALGDGAAKVLALGVVDLDGRKVWATQELGRAMKDGQVREWNVLSYHSCAGGLRLLAIEADYDYPVGGGVVSRTFEPPLLVYPADLAAGAVWDYRSTVTEEHEDFVRSLQIDAVRSAEARAGGLTMTERHADGRTNVFELASDLSVERGPDRELTAKHDTDLQAFDRGSRTPL